MSDRYSKSLLVDRNYSTSRFANGISASGLDTSAHKQETFRTQEPKKATKLKIPKLPLDSLLEEDSDFEYNNELLRTIIFPKKMKNIGYLTDKLP